ncbi:hypothetical protein [Plantibacter sp. YIM 135249]|uniref:hypothetical protein n=1 Tax=Plantibacter sp. YIM 135249 TaxID=3423918 RepID=UPI003D333669
MTENLKPHDEIITISMPVWAFQGIMNGIQKWTGDHWDAHEITEPIKFDTVPASWRIEVEDGQRRLILATDDTP